MKILHIVSSLPKKGWPRNTFIKSQIDSLKEIGIEVDTFEVNSWPGKKINYFLGFFGLRKHLKNNEYDLIHAHYIYSGLIAVSQRRVPVVYSYMGSEILGTPDISGKMTLLGRINILLSRLLQYFVDEIIVKSDNLLEKLDASLSVSVVPNGVNFNTFRSMDKAECRKKLGLNKHNKIVLFLGKTDDPRKNYSLAQSSIEYLNSYSNRKINIELVAPNSIAPEEVPVYMNASDVLLQTSLWEGSPNVIKEAMACNIPIVSTDVGDVKKVIIDTKGCFLTEFDSESIGHAIDNAISFNSRTLGRNDIKHLRSERVAETIKSIYATLLAKKGKGI